MHCNCLPGRAIVGSCRGHSREGLTSEPPGGGVLVPCHQHPDEQAKPGHDAQLLGGDEDLQRAKRARSPSEHRRAPARGRPRLRAMERSRWAGGAPTRDCSPLINSMRRTTCGRAARAGGVHVQALATKRRRRLPPPAAASAPSYSHPGVRAAALTRPGPSLRPPCSRCAVGGRPRRPPGRSPPRGPARCPPSRQGRWAPPSCPRWAPAGTWAPPWPPSSLAACSAHPRPRFCLPLHLPICICAVRLCNSVRQRRSRSTAVRPAGVQVVQWVA